MSKIIKLKQLEQILAASGLDAVQVDDIITYHITHGKTLTYSFRTSEVTDGDNVTVNEFLQSYVTSERSKRYWQEQLHLVNFINSL